MNIEFEVKEIIRTNGTKEQRAENICKIANFSKEKVIKGLGKEAKTVSEVYWNIVMEHRK